MHTFWYEYLQPQGKRMINTVYQIHAWQYELERCISLLSNIFWPVQSCLEIERKPGALPYIFHHEIYWVIYSSHCVELEVQRCYTIKIPDNVYCICLAVATVVLESDMSSAKFLVSQHTPCSWQGPLLSNFLLLHPLDKIIYLGTSCRIANIWYLVPNHRGIP